MESTRKQIIDLIGQGRLPEEHIEQALELTQVYLSENRWHCFLDRMCLWMGGLFLGVSLIFFVAYNWSVIGRFAKFGLVESLIIGGVAAYCKFVDHPIIGKLSLLVSVLFLGAFMALYGQTYQTGADPWQLFSNWALFMLPWACIGRFPVLWVVWITLINLSLILYYQTFRGVLGSFFLAEESVLWLIFAVNTLFLLAWEWLSCGWSWLQARWAVRLLALGSGAPVSWLCMITMFDDDAGVWTGLIWAGWMLSFYFVYRKVKPDLFMLAGMCLSGIVVITVFMSKYMAKDAGGFLLLGLLVLGMGAGAAAWLKSVNKDMMS